MSFAIAKPFVDAALTTKSPSPGLFHGHASPWFVHPSLSTTFSPADDAIEQMTITSLFDPN